MDDILAPFLANFYGSKVCFLSAGVDDKSQFKEWFLERQMIEMVISNQFGLALSNKDFI